MGKSQSQWLCGLRRRSAAARLLRLWVRIPPGAWMFVCCECCVLSGRGLWSLQWADHLSRGVLPTVVRRCVWSRNLLKEEAMAHWGLLQKKKTVGKNAAAIDISWLVIAYADRFILAWFQASAAAYMRSSLFWDFMQRRWVVNYQSLCFISLLITVGQALKSGTFVAFHLIRAIPLCYISVLYFNIVLNTTIYNYLKDV